MKSKYWVLLCVAALFLYVIATGPHRSESAFDSLEKDIQKIKNAVLRKGSESTPASESEVEFMHETAAHGAHRMHAAENAQPSEQEDRGFMERASEQAATLKRNVEEQLDAITSSIMSRGQSSSSSLMEQADRRLNALKESVWSSSHEPGVQEWFGNRLTEFKDSLSAMQDVPADLKSKVDQRLTEMSDSFRQHLESIQDKTMPAASSDSPSLKERMQEHLHSIAESLKSHIRRSPSQSQSEEQADVQPDMPTSGGHLRQQPIDEVDPRAILVAEEAVTVGEHLKQTSAALNEQLRQGAESMRDRMEESAGNLKERAESVGAHLKESVSESAENLKERAEAVGAHLKGSLSESAENLKERAEATGTYLKERAADAGEYVKDKASDASHYVKDKLSDAGNSLKGHASAVKDKASDTSDYLQDKASDVGDYLKDKVSDAGDYVKDRAHGARESAAEYTQDAKERLSETAEQLKERAEFEGQRVKNKVHMQAAGEETSHGLGERIVGEVSSAFAATQEALRHATDAIHGTLRKIPEQLDFTHSHRFMIQSTQSVNGRSVSYSNVNGKESLVFDSDIMPSEEGQLDALNSFRKAHGLSAKNSLEAVNVVKHQKQPHHLEIVAARTTNGVGYLYEYRDGEEDLSIIGSNAPKEQPDVLKLLNSFRKQYGLPERSSLPSKLDRKELPQKGEQQATSMLGLSEASSKTEL